MEVAVSDLLFPGFEKTELRKLNRTYGIEFFYEFGKDSYWDQERAFWKKRSLSIHGPCVSVNLADPQDKGFLQIFSETFAYARRCGARFVVVHTNEAVTGEAGATRDLVIRRLHKLLALAREYGVQMAVENVGLVTKNNLLFPLPEFLRLFDELPGAKALLDVGHAHINGWDPAEVAEALGNNLIACHLHDNNGGGDQHLPIGQGTVDWNCFFSVVKKAVPVLVLEYAGGFPDVESLESHMEELSKIYGLYA